MNEKPRIFTMPFGTVYPLYVQKAERKGRTREEVDQILSWLTGYSGEQLQQALDLVPADAAPESDVPAPERGVEREGAGPEEDVHGVYCLVPGALQRSR